jgi:hypothetical protein
VHVCIASGTVGLMQPRRLGCSGPRTRNRSISAIINMLELPVKLRNFGLLGVEWPRGGSGGSSTSVTLNRHTCVDLAARCTQRAIAVVSVRERRARTY